MRKTERRRNRSNEKERERMTIRERPRWHLKSKSKKGICARVFIHFPLTFLVCPIPLGLSFAIQSASKKTEGRGRERGFEIGGAWQVAMPSLPWDRSVFFWCRTLASRSSFRFHPFVFVLFLYLLSGFNLETSVELFYNDGRLETEGSFLISILPSQVRIPSYYTLLHSSPIPPIIRVLYCKI